MRRPGLAGSWAWLQSIDYNYNTQGWLTGINHWNPSATVGIPASCTPALPNPSSPSRTTYNENSDVMYMHILYDQTFSGVAGSIQKAGNIAQMAYRVRGRETNMYSYAYDYLSRLSSSTFYEYNDSGVLTNSNKYNESLTYDLRGNIQTLQRTGYYTNGGTCTFGQIDNLTYHYPSSPASNKVHKILDATTTAGDAKSRGLNGLLSTADNSITYDANGNINKNLHKNISRITYNHLNLPRLITFSTGNSIEFLYDAAGTKLRKTTKTGSTIQYVQDYLPGGLEYRQNGTGVKRLESVFHPEGRYYNTNVDVNNTYSWRKDYNFQDHLGNTRLVFTDRTGNGVVDITGTASTSDILQENHYYSFGLGFEGPWLMNDGGVRDNAYQYNVKELHSDFGLGMYAYGARYYDPSIGRFTGVDPIADEYPFVTTFNYAENEPIANIDLHGLQRQRFSLKELALRTGAFLAGTSNALYSNVTGVGRGNPQDFGRYASDAKNGQAIGDAISVVGGVIGGIGAGVAIVVEGAGVVTAPAIAPTAAAGALSLHTAYNGASNLVKASGGDDKSTGEPKITAPYKRPSYSVTKKQRESVQGKPCVTCGKKDGKRIADHKDPLVEEYYSTGKIDKEKMRKVESVQPQCETCSARQGAEMSKFSKEQKKKHEGNFE